MPVHLRPMAPTAHDAIVCGDPARALLIAEALLPKPRMSNHHRGLWGYWGTDLAGCDLTVQSTGIGGPSAAVVVEELAGLGVRRLIRIGSARTGAGGASVGTAFAVSSAVAGDGASVALGNEPGAVLEPDPELTGKLRLELPRHGRVLSRDLHPSPAQPPPADAYATDLQTAAILTAAGRYEIAVAAALLITESGGVRLEDDPLEAGMRVLGGAAQRALHS
ncbi:MAG: hypothetical protein ACR2K6_08875 [Solirubrobacterales bacterium]